MDEIRAAVYSHMDQMAALFESFGAELRKQWNSGSDGKFMEPILGFIHAVDWTEPWLITLTIFHIILLILAITTRKNSNFQMGLFLATLMGVYFAEKINYYLGRNWEKFATQDYFDKHGVFLSNLWSGPLLIISTIILTNTLVTLSQLIVKWKKAELRHRARVAREKNE
uniref:Transmembrane protein 18 n=1 Tax=Picea sitchensis TaxID=3332 RepID=D5A8R1_PICSI|nr:unknown [Picea sitchensis]